MSTCRGSTERPSGSTPSRSAPPSCAAARDVIGIGSQVEVEDDLGERMTVRVSSVSGEGAVSQNRLSGVLMGAKAGDEVTVRAPRTTYVARVVSVSV